MRPVSVGLLHPGEMGAFIAAVAARNGHRVHWASHGRSPATRLRAAQAGLHDLGSVPQVCAACSVILSVCPPHAAETVAQAVIEGGFRGLYVDANAIAPQRAAGLAAALEAAGSAYVDGAILGGPAWRQGQTDLYLSGARAHDVAALLANPALRVRVLGPAPGQASALKMCYAAYTKGTTALLAAILAAADALDVREPLEEQWTQDDPGFAQQSAQRVCRATAKAWRFAGEMEEIAATFGAAGLPGEFHLAAAELYRRLSDFKQRAAPPDLDEVIAALRRV